MTVFFPYLLAGMIAMQAPGQISGGDDQTGIEQLPTTSRGDISVDQASGTRAAPSISTGQISSPEPSSQEASARQVSASEPIDPDVDQLASRENSTTQDGSISSPAAGRTARIDVPTGADRCDTEAQRTRPDICRNVIETRSAEFEGPRRPELSPEERLLTERSDVARSRTLLDAVRTAGQAGAAGDEESQVLASLVLQNPPSAQTAQPGRPDEPELGAETQALIEAIVSGLTNQGAPAP